MRWKREIGEGRICTKEKDMAYQKEAGREYSYAPHVNHIGGMYR